MTARFEAAPGGAVTLRSGLVMPRLGLGTWRMGETPARRGEEIRAVHRALDGGIAHIDTAEMYGEGETEALLGEALASRPRDGLFLVSKVYPWNAGGRAMVEACEASLRRLRTDYLDLYLLHWPGSIAFEATLAAAETLLAAGKIRAFGVSNVDVGLLGRLAEAGLADRIDANQVMHNPSRRGVEFDLYPAMATLGIQAVAYTPLEPARLGRNRAFAAVAEAEGLSPAQLALTWHLTAGRAVPIPKAGQAAHVDALLAAAARRLAPDAMAAIDAACPPPRRAQPLDII
ncbi:MAG: aldo/keto reductase [Pseudomonadota bacterium]